jgi:hypothetical protein
VFPPLLRKRMYVHVTCGLQDEIAAVQDLSIFDDLRDSTDLKTCGEDGREDSHSEAALTTAALSVALPSASPAEGIGHEAAHSFTGIPLARGTALLLPKTSSAGPSDAVHFESSAAGGDVSQPLAVPVKPDEQSDRSMSLRPAKQDDGSVREALGMAIASSNEESKGMASDPAVLSSGHPPEVNCDVTSLLLAPPAGEACGPDAALTTRILQSRELRLKQLLSELQTICASAPETALDATAVDVAMDRYEGMAEAARPPLEGRALLRHALRLAVEDRLAARQCAPHAPSHASSHLAACTSSHSHTGAPTQIRRCHGASCFVTSCPARPRLVYNDASGSACVYAYASLCC